MSKTIFITSCHPLISRNIISTGILDLLLKNNSRVVLIVPIQKVDFFTKAFGREGVYVEGVNIKSSKREGFLKYLSLASLNTNTLNIKRKTEMKGSGSFAKFLLSNFISHFIIRKIEKYSYNNNLFGNLFKKYNPNSVFVTDIQNEIDISLLIEAQSNKIYTLGMVRSWDNLTSKGLIRVIPDRLIVWNEIVRDEAIRFHDIKKDNIVIVGIPHYDDYKKYDYSNKKTFFERIGADINKKIALVIPIGDRYLRDNTVDRDIVAILDKHLPQNFQILVRMPPGDYVRELENKPNQFNRIKVIYDRSYMATDNIKTTEIRKDDDIHLGQTLFWSDLVISGPSTVVIDSVYMNKPTILFGFDGYEKRDYYDSIRRYYDYDNFVPIIKSEGARYTVTIDDFVESVKKYIENPILDDDKRKDLVKKEVSVLDGNSTNKLFKVLIESMK